MITVKINTLDGFVEVPSIASTHGIHLVASLRFARTYNLIEEFYGTSLGTVSKRVGLAFLKGSRTGQTLKRFHDAHAETHLGIEEMRKRNADRSNYIKWRAAWLAPSRYVKMLERCK